MSLPDYDPRKWVYEAHTRVKHVILEEYLKAWVPILGSQHPRVCYFDGFAGKGRYPSGEEGSPLIAMRVAEEICSVGRAREVVCVFIEKDPENYADLLSSIAEARQRYPSVRALDPIQGEFADVIANILKQVRARLAPSFFFIDPFGWSGVPFDLVKEIMSLRRTEVFFTFMIRDIARFLDHPSSHHTLTSLFGTDKWQQFANLPFKKRSIALLNLYIDQLHSEAGVKFVIPFRVREDIARRDLYYLIHATNHFRGLQKMKWVMYKAGQTMPFAYLGPDERPGQLRLFSRDEENVQELQRELPDHFAGRTLSFDQILEESWDWPYLEKHYRAALKELRSQGIITVTPVTSKTSRGLQGKDGVCFPL